MLRFREKSIKTKMDRILSSVDGRVIEINIGVGDKIDVGDVLVVVEAMKVEIEIVSNVKGRVGGIYVEFGDLVRQNDLLLIIGDEESVDISFNESLINELVHVILSNNVFYILCDDDYKNVTGTFESSLKAKGMNTIFLGDDSEYEFKKNLCGDANLLIISKSGDNEEMWNLVKTARLNNIKVYGICGNFRFGVVTLCDESIIFNNHFDTCLDEIFSIVYQKVHENLSKDNPISVPLRPPGNVIAPFNGTVIEVKVNLNDRVRKGDILLVMESMKMENDIMVEIGGIVDKIYVQPGDYVSRDDVIMNIKKTL